MPYKPTWKERLEEAEPYLGPAIAGLVVLALAGWLVWHELLTPGKATKTVVVPTKAEVAQNEAKRRLSVEVDVLEGIYQRDVGAGKKEAELGGLLDRAIAKQRERLQLEPAGDTVETARLARLEAERGALRTRVASAQSEAHERAAQASPGSVESMEKLREALRLQREANATAAATNFPREARLARTVGQAELEPAQAAVAAALTRARDALARGQHDAASQAFTEAQAMQADLNRRFPGTPGSHPALVDQIGAELESLSAAGLAETSATREREAEAAAKLGRVPQAAAAYAAAAAIQREINAKFPRSSVVSVARLEQLEAKRQTLLSTAPLAAAAALDGEIATLLRRRLNSAAIGKINAASALVEKTAAENPRSTELDQALQNRLAYLGLRTGELDSLQEAIYSRLVPLPGLAGVSMLGTEVDQDLYTRVMNENPSRNPGLALPVDSVSWHDAQDFCRRLGWLLGCRVRLPTAAEFRAAHGGDEGAWSAGTSDGRSHEIGRSPRATTGFFDLAGNLAEWLQPAADSGETASVAGGSFLDDTDVLRRLPVVAMEKQERARHVGFRVVVEVPPP